MSVVGFALMPDDLTLIILNFLSLINLKTDKKLLSYVNLKKYKITINFLKNALAWMFLSF